MLYPISLPLPNSTENLVGYIDGQGNTKISPCYARGLHFCEGVAAVRDTSGRCGFINTSGQKVIPFDFRSLARFNDGLCAIDGGYIMHTGEWSIKPQFLVASEFSEGLAFVSVDGIAFGFIDPTGKFVVKPSFVRCGLFHEGAAAVCSGDRWGYVDRQGTFAIPAVFEGNRATAFSYGMAGVRIDDRWGFIDHHGSFVVSPRFEAVKPFIEGHACVQCNGQWGFVDTEGRQVAECKFDELGQLNQGIAPARLNGRAGYVSNDGRWLIETAFDKCYAFFGDLAVVRREKQYSYIRRDGAIVWTSDLDAGVPHPPPPLLV
jgi:hypothetical protein